MGIDQGPTREVLSSRQDDENTRAPALACVLAVCVWRFRTWTRLLVVVLWCSAVRHLHSTSNDAVCVVVRSL